MDFSANLAYFDRSDLALIQGRFLRLMEEVLAHPERPMGQLELLPQAERQTLLVDWNALQATAPDPACVHERFEAQVRRTPEAVALVFGTESLSYRELNRRANRLAHHLRALGVGPDRRVAICAERSPETVVGLLAILKAGGAYVPLDPAYPLDRLAFMVADSEPVVLLARKGQFQDLALPPGLPVLDLDQAGSGHPDHDPQASEVGLTSSHMAYVIYTSGSTGTPKGVMVEHRNVVRLFTATQAWFGFGTQDVWTWFHSCAFDFSVWEIWGALLHGGRLVLVPQATVRSPEAFYRLVCRERVTILNQTPSAFLPFIQAQARSLETHRLRCVIIGGEALEVGTLAPWYARHGDGGPLLVNMYGITETTVHVTYRPLGRADLGHLGGSPIGCRIPDLTIRILDPQGRPAPVGVAGELYVGGAGVARGYLNRPELTAERFLPDPFSAEPGARLYRTGDLGRWLPGGALEFLGRNDHQVKIRGYRIELGEIEARLREHPQVAEAVVIAREDGEGAKRLVAYLVASGAIAADGLRAHLCAALPGYMIPAAFVCLPAMPLTPHGKLDRAALPDPGAGDHASRAFQEPQGAAETALAGLWAELLKLERVGRQDNFFELGGHSLLVLRALAMLQRADLSVTIADCFSHPTLEALAARISPAPGPGQDQALLIRSGGQEPPLFLAPEGAGTLLYGSPLAACLDPGYPVYGLPVDPGGPGAARTVQAMAARMVSLIRAVQPEGPYRLAGWSFGGLLAYEIARQILGQDQEVAFLGMLDTTCPGSAPAGGPPGDPRAFLLQVLPFKADADTLEQLQAMLAAAQEASARYRVQPLPLPVHLFSALETPSADALRGWDRVVPPERLHLIPVAGTHHTMLQAPHIADLGKALSAALAGASPGVQGSSGSFGNYG